MKVLYFHQHFTTPSGAGGTRSYQMAKAIIASGGEVTMVCGSYAGGDTGLDKPFDKGVRSGIVEGISIYEFDLHYTNKDSFLRRSITFLKYSLLGIKFSLTHDYDVLFATSTPLTAAIPGLAAKWFRKKTFVFEVRDLWPELPREMGVITNPVTLWLLALLEKISYRAADRLIGLSPGIVRGISRILGTNQSIEMIPNGCDLQEFQAPRTGQRPIGIGQDQLLALYMGTHGIANRLDAVLDVAKVLTSKGREDIKIMLIGDGKEKQRLQLRAEEESLHNVCFHAPVSKHDLVSIVAEADIGLQILANVPAFYYGTSPNKFFDYLAAGKAVICNYPGWVAELITEHQAGWAVPPEDPEKFADALIEAADNRQLVKEAGTQARVLAVQKFDRTMLAQQFVSVIQGTQNPI